MENINEVSVFDCDHQPNGSQPETRPNNARRLKTLLYLLDAEIEDKSLIGIAYWAKEARECMICIEVDNNLRG